MFQYSDPRTAFIELGNKCSEATCILTPYSKLTEQSVLSAFRRSDILCSRGRDDTTTGLICFRTAHPDRIACIYVRVSLVLWDPENLGHGMREQNQKKKKKEMVEELVAGIPESKRQAADKFRKVQYISIYSAALDRVEDF